MGKKKSVLMMSSTSKYGLSFSAIKAIVCLECFSSGRKEANILREKKCFSLCSKSLKKRKGETPYKYDWVRWTSTEMY